MQRQMVRPTCLGGSLSTSQASISVSQVLQSGNYQPDVGASYVVSASGAQLRLGDHYQVSSTGAHELNPLTGSTKSLGKSFMDYELGLPAAGDSVLKCRHISELDIDNGCLIGQGSSAKVYAVVHMPTGVRVCVKQMHIDDSRHREEVKRELDSLHKAASRYIVDFYGAFFHNDMGVILLVLELLEGSLSDVLKERGGFISEFEAKALAFQLIQGLQFLHDERQLMHRDVKPANILIHRSGSIKIADFGISRSQSGDAASVQTFVGSISYMSPERLQGNSYGYEADIWSVGVVLYEAVTGAHPYHDDPNGAPLTFWTLLQKVVAGNAVMHNSPLKHRAGREHLSSELDNFLARCLAFKREERASAKELASHPWFADMDMSKSEMVIRDMHTSILAAKLRQRALSAATTMPGNVADSSARRQDSQVVALPDTPPGDEPTPLADSNVMFSAGAPTATALLSTTVLTSDPTRMRGQALLSSLMGM